MLIKLLYKSSHELVLIEVAVSCDNHIMNVEQAKIQVCQDVARKTEEIYQTLDEIFPFCDCTPMSIFRKLST